MLRGEEMTNKEKSLIFNALTYSDSPSYWGLDNVKDYLRELKKDFNEVFLTIKPTELRNRILFWINKCDPKLTIFLDFNKRMELEKGKTCQLFEIPSTIVKEIDDILSKQQELSYDALNMGTWEHPKLVFSTKKGNTFEMWYAVKAFKHASKNFNFKKFPEDVQDSLVSILENAVPDMYELEKIRLEYNVFARIINIITFDTNQKKISISTDQPKVTDPDDTEENLPRPEDRLGPVFDKILNSIGISKKSTRSISEKRRVNTNSVKRIRAKETKDLLLLPFRFDFINNAGDLTAVNVTKFLNLTTKNILPLVDGYYSKNNTFVGFFNAYPTFDAQNNSDFLRIIVNSKNTEDEAAGFFLFIIINKEIHIARVICNITTGSLRIFLKKGKGSYEYINSELDKIFS